MQERSWGNRLLQQATSAKALSWMAAIMLPFPAALTWKLEMPVSLSQPGFVSTDGPGGGRHCSPRGAETTTASRINLSTPIGWPFTVQLKDKSLFTAYALTAYLLQPPETTATEVVRWRLP